jgi:fumarate reductase subunit D
VDLTTLFPLFMAWAKTMGSSLRSELQTIGLALHEGRMDEVSRGIQSHLENAIVSFMLFKVVSKSMEAAADRVAGVLGDLLVEEEERAKVCMVGLAVSLCVSSCWLSPHV